MTETLVERAQKFTEHTMYCQWVRDRGYYDRSLPCTCGLDELMAELSGYGQQSLWPQEVESEPEGDPDGG